MSKAKFGEYAKIYKKIPKDVQPAAEKLIQDLMFMNATLQQLREAVADGGCVEDFKNGKQQFTRELPALTSYNKTLKMRNATHDALIKLIPKESSEQSASDGFDEFVTGRSEI